MVGLNPSKFYGRLLPRPRIYCDVKFSDARVDPPESVNAALLEWAGDASWRMGGTAAKRKRMSGKIEGRMSKLRAMEESDDDKPPPPKKSVKEKQSLAFERQDALPASVLAKHMTPIERMLTSPESKRKKLAPRRIVASEDDVETEKQELVVKPRARRSRKEQVIEESDDDSDDDLEAFMQKVEAAKHTPNRTIRRSTRLQASPSSPRTPDSKRKSVSKTTPKRGKGKALALGPLGSPALYKRKRNGEDSVSESDAQSEMSESVIL